MPEKTLIFRFDAGESFGAGHFMRQLAIAERASLEGDAVMLMPKGTEHLKEAVASRIKQVPLPELTSALEVQWLSEQFVSTAPCFVDSYVLPNDYYAALKKTRPVIAFEDGERTLAANVVVKPRPSATSQFTSALLEGCCFIPIREEFRRIERSERPTLKKSLLVTFGASDPFKKTAEILRALPSEYADRWRLVVAIGPLAASDVFSEDDRKHLQARGWEIQVEHSPSMSALIASVDAAISASGSTVWELASLRIPTIAIPVAQNQQRNFTLLRKAGCIATLDELDRFLSDEFFRAETAARLHKQVDGRGAERIVAHVRSQTFGGLS